MTQHYIIMGICGCGKTTVAEALQQQLHCPFAAGDVFHTQANRDKMGAGIPAPRSNAATAIFCGKRRAKCILYIYRRP